jgi:adenylate cyclase
MERLERTAIVDWIVHAGLSGVTEVDLLAGVCERLRDAGIALVRGSVANDLLDPTYDARGVRWLRDRGGVEARGPRRP